MSIIICQESVRVRVNKTVEHFPAIIAGQTRDERVDTIHIQIRASVIAIILAPKMIILVSEKLFLSNYARKDQ